VDLSFDQTLGEGYRSKTQIARVLTQDWVGRELECLACSSQRLNPTPQNTKARDFVCGDCHEPYELKSTSGRFGPRVNDGSYDTLLRTIEAGRTPNLLLMEYDEPAGQVRNLSAIHRRLLSPIAVVPRRPLSASARRAGWKGCVIDLSRVPPEGRIGIVSKSEPVPWPVVRAGWAQLRFLVDLGRQEEGWLRDVLACIQRLEGDAFDLSEVYRFEAELATLHPGNRNVRPKIRQQLQQLVAKGILARTEPGKYHRKRGSAGDQIAE
jgi:type II restriction enzyme